MLKIEKKVALPQDSGRGRAPTELTKTAAIMEIGDSVVVNKKAALCLYVWGARQKPKRRFTMRKTADKKLRVWRVT
jgi:hypothetical protein